MAIRILNVIPGSPADRAGILAGWMVEKMNGEPVLDEIDYQALSAHRLVHMELRKKNGESFSARIVKEDWAPLGLTLDETAQMKPRQCKNHCQFCFIDQIMSCASSRSNSRKTCCNK